MTDAELYAHQVLAHIEATVDQPTAGLACAVLLAESVDCADYGERDKADALVRLACHIALQWRAHHLSTSG